MPEQTTTTTVPDTVAQQIAALEQRITALPPELRAQFQEMLELTRSYERCRAIEEATRVKLPPDTNRWGASAPPPPSTPAAESSPERPTGWQAFDPIGLPPGVDICDRLMDAQDRRDKAALIEAERLAYRQQVIDAHWEDKLIEQERRRKQAERTCHRGPDDSDWDIK